MANKIIKSRAWCFTKHYTLPFDFDGFQNRLKECVYGMYGEEVCPQTGSLHLQGWVYVKHPVTLNTIKQLIDPTAHFEKCMGSPVQNETYCRKARGAVWTHGLIPKQGKRNDVGEVKEIINQGGNMRDVVEETNSLPAWKAGEVYIKYTEGPDRTGDLNVVWVWGKSGAGKSHMAREMLPDAYWKPPGKWWDGYDGHPNVIVDDYRADHFPFSVLLNYLDKYPCRIENKGGSRWLKACKFVITSPYHPRDYVPVGEDPTQLLRRIKEVIECVGILAHPGTEVGGNTIPQLEIDNIAE